MCLTFYEKSYKMGDSRKQSGIRAMSRCMKALQSEGKVKRCAEFPVSREENMHIREKCVKDAGAAGLFDMLFTQGIRYLFA